MPKWQIVTVIAPATVTYGESFIWHRPLPRLQVGVALLWKQGAFRGLGNYELIPQTAKSPNLRIGFGLQGIGTGNPGYFATSEKTLEGSVGIVTGYVGIGWRANEDHSHGLAGLKFTPKGQPWTVGFQADGHSLHEFVTYQTRDGWSIGAYLIESKMPGLMFSWGR